MKLIVKLFCTLLFMWAMTIPSGASGLVYNVQLRDSILSRISGAKIPDNKVSILKFGAKGDGVSDCRKAFDKAMKYADKGEAPIYRFLPGFII